MREHITSYVQPVEESPRNVLSYRKLSPMKVRWAVLRAFREVADLTADDVGFFAGSIAMDHRRWIPSDSQIMQAIRELERSGRLCAGRQTRLNQGLRRDYAWRACA